MSRFPQVMFGDFTKEVSRPVLLEPGIPYRSVGVKWYGEGVYVYETREGQEFDAQRFEIRTDDLIYNDMWARKGSVAIVSRELTGAVASAHFPTFELDRERVEPSYLRWYFKTPTFWDACELASRGSTGRNQIKRRTFLTITLPLPTLSEQRRVVGRIEEVAEQIGMTNSIRREEEREIKNMLAGAFWRLTRAAPRQQMAEVAPLVRRPVQVDPSSSYLELGIRSFGKGTFHKPPVTGFDLGSKRVFQIVPGDLLFTNVFAWEGAIAVASPADAGRVGSHRYITCVPKAGTATAEFLHFYFLTEEGLAKIGSASPGGAGRNRTLGLDALSRIDVPVPPYESQVWFDALQAEVGALRDLQTETSRELDALLPMTIDLAFRGEL